TYDAGAANGKGRLVAISSSAAINQIAGYDVLGRVAGSSQTIDGQPYVFSYSYNLADALTSMTYPSQRVVATAYDGANRPASVSGSYNGTPTTYLWAVSYAPHGGWAAHTFGNQIAQMDSYNNRLQPTEMKDGLPVITSGVMSIPNPVLDLQYFWGSPVLNGNSAQNNGNLTNLQIQTPGAGGNSTLTFWQTYVYDRLNRISSAGDNGGSGWSEQFDYDQYGNAWLSSAPSGLPIQSQMPTASAF
ncbi:MAG: hypothetical protein ABI165_13715, partial [Bryobacteraceae bacterium]